MSEVRFTLKEPSSTEPTLINLVFRYNNYKLKYSTGQKIKPRFWNSENQRARQSRSFTEYAQLNTLLDNLESGLKNAYRGLINDKKEPTAVKLKEALNKILFLDDINPNRTLFKFIEELIAQSPRKMNTLKQWKQTQRKLIEYKRENKKELDFDDIDLDFYNNFILFLKKEGYTKNSIGCFIKNVKVFMNEAVERKLTKNLEYKNKKFKVMEEQVDKIYLSVDELNKIYSLDLKNNERLDKVRDLFIVACYTGLRFSDLKQVQKDNFDKSGNYLRIKTEKTGEQVVIPLHKYVRDIILKYDGNIPVTISNQKMNEYLKEIGALAEINHKIKIGITRGGVIEHDTFKKLDLITTHTARRSFATNAFLRDVPTISIMKITGHRTEKSFMKYIRISQEENANKLLSHPFFS